MGCPEEAGGRATHAFRTGRAILGAQPSWRSEVGTRGGKVTVERVTECVRLEGGNDLACTMLEKEQ